MVRQRIDEIKNAIKDFDYVNIQAELGLFGLSPDQMIKNITELIKASKNVIVTIHRVDYMKSNQRFLRNIFVNPRSIKKEIKSLLRKNLSNQLIKEL